MLISNFEQAFLQVLLADVNEFLDIYINKSVSLIIISSQLH